MTKIPVKPRFLAPRSHRQGVAFFVYGDRRRGKIFLLLSLVTKIDLAVRFENNLCIGTSPDVDGPEFNIDHQFSAGRYINLLRKIFFRRNYGAKRDEQDKQRIAKNGEHRLVDWLRFV